MIKLKKILLLTFICFFVFAYCDTIKNPFEVAICDAEVIMEGAPIWTSHVFGEGTSGPYFGAIGSEHRGALKSVGTTTAYSVRLNMTLYDPDGNYLADRYANFWEAGVGYVGTSITLQPDDEIYWTCWWLKDENMELWEQLNHSVNPYRPDCAPEKCFVITWEDSESLRG